MKQFVNNVMRDKNTGKPAAAVKPVLYVLSLFYWWGIRVWDFMYGSGLLKQHKIRTRVISVGNITVGGTGKTPFTLYLAEAIQKTGKKVCILIRGYGDDEWKMLGENLKDVRVVVGRDRVKNALEAERLYSPDAIILDDGFQHRRLKSRVSVVLIDARNPFGNMHVIPRGILREPVSALSRADIIIINKSDFGRENTDELYAFLKVFFPKAFVYRSIYRPAHVVMALRGDKRKPEVLKGKNAAVVTAIADNAYLKHILTVLGCKILKEFDYPDHYIYTLKDLDRVEKETSECEYIVTTEKDAVKLADLPISEGLRNKIAVLRVDLEIVGDSDAEELIERISGYSGS